MSTMAKLQLKVACAGMSWLLVHGSRVMIFLKTGNGQHG